MEDLRSLFFHQASLETILDKYGILGGETLIPWNEGYALTDKTGSIINFLTINSNGEILLQNDQFSTMGRVSSVVDNQYELYENHKLIGHLFEGHSVENLDVYFDTSTHGAIELLSDVLELEVDSLDTIMNIVDFF